MGFSVRMRPILLFFLCFVATASLAAEEPLLPPGDSIAFSSDSFRFHALDGEINLHAIASGLGMLQTNPIQGDYNSLADLSNAQLILKKDSGLFQFYIQSGYYSTPSLGTTYQRAIQQTKDSFGIVPLASASIALDNHWLLSAGKINSFGGYENTFTYQNINIDRGLLWNQTSNVSKGLEVSYSEGDTNIAFTWNDGFYSNQLSWLGASLDYQLSPQDSARIVWTGSVKPNTTNTFITPILQNNSQIFNVIYTYQSDRWSVTPYLQYTYVPANVSLGTTSNVQTAGAAILASYRFFNDSAVAFTLPFRLEYIGSSGKSGANTPNLLYGAGSAAWSATITPTYQYRRAFIRGELSYVQALNTALGQAFGPTGSNTNQTRVMLEVGFLY